MLLDIILVAIVLLFAFFGFKKGFFFGIPRFIGLIIAIAGAIFTNKPIYNFLEAKTPLFDTFHNSITKICAGFISDYVGDSPEKLPTGLSTVFDDLKDAATKAAINTISETAFSILIFLTTFVIIKIALSIIIKTFSKKNQGGFIGGIDGILGLALGTIKGIIIIFILIIFIFPFSFIFSKNAYSFFDTQMQSSIIADYIILHNPLTNFLPSLDISAFLPSNWGPDIDTNISKNLDNLV